MSKPKSSLGRAMAVIEITVTTIMAAVRRGEDAILEIPDEKIKEAAKKYVADLIVMAKKAFTINVGGNRTAEEVVRAGKYNYANPNIGSELFPMRSRTGKRQVVLVDVPGEGPTFTFDEALAALQANDLGRPDYEDGLLFGEQHPEEQRANPILFPHEPVLVHGNRDVVYLWGRAGYRKLSLDWTAYRWYRFVHVAGVRK